jgi:DNA-directed RNA polymerase subunit RPC12/RpoP
MECYNCGQPVPDGSERCPTCGQRFAVVKKTRTKSPLASLGCGSLLVIALLTGLVTLRN